MNLDKIKEIASKLHAGASYVVVYKTKVATVDGSDACKITSKPCRLGVRYSHLKHMIGQTAKPLPGNGKWVIDRYVYQDSNGYKLRITNGAFGKPVSTYVNDAGKQIDMNIVKIAKRNGCVPIVQCICLENVIAIKCKGEEL